MYGLGKDYDKHLNSSYAKYRNISFKKQPNLEYNFIISPEVSQIIQRGLPEL